MKKSKSDYIYTVIQFIFLLIVLMGSAVIFSQTADDFLRFIIIFFNCMFYIAWGIWHHYIIDRITKEVIIEYVLVALLIIIISATGLGVIRFF